MTRSILHSIYFLITSPFFRLGLGNEIYESGQINRLDLIICRLDAALIAALSKQPSLNVFLEILLFQITVVHWNPYLRKMITQR